MECVYILYRLFHSLFKGKLGSSQETTTSSVLPQPPDTNDQEAWKRHWKACKQPWRTEPEIDTKRQEELKQRLAIVPDVEQGIYPFKCMNLSRADVEWHGIVSVAGVHWGDVDLTVVDWTQVKCLGDECLAHEIKNRNGIQKDAVERLEEHQRAVRANSKLAIALQEQGLNEEAARFAYRAQRLQKTVLRMRATQSRINIKERMRMIRAWLFSWFLFLLTGYGYKPGRSFLAYFLVILGFTGAYYLLGHTINPPFTPFGAFIFSMTSFHGRGFFPLANIPLDSSITALAAFEAFIGLIIEATFIATLTQRLFGR